MRLPCNSGQVVGYSVDSGTINPFIYTSGGGIQSLTAALGASAMPWGINGSNQIVGHYSDPNNGYATSAFIYNLTSNTVTSLGEYSSGSHSVAKAINSSGEVVGYAEDSKNVFHAFTSQGSGMTIFDPTGSSGSYALGINDSGLVVGYYKTSSGGYSAFEYNDTTVTDLNTLGIAPGWTLQRATGVNNAGDIVGYGIDPSGNQEAFLLTPVPAPASGVFLAAGAGTLLLCRRRKDRPGAGASR